MCVHYVEHGSTDDIIHGSSDDIIHGSSDDIIHGSADDIIHGSADDIIHGSADDIIHGSCRLTRSDTNPFEVSDSVVEDASDPHLWRDNDQEGDNDQDVTFFFEFIGF